MQPRFGQIGSDAHVGVISQYDSVAPLNDGAIAQGGCVGNAGSSVRQRTDEGVVVFGSVGLSGASSKERVFSPRGVVKTRLVPNK